MFYPLLFPGIAAVSFVITALWLSLARRRQWLDHPNFRSSHEIPTPKSGGIGFVLGFVCSVAWLFFLGELAASTASLFAGGLMLALLGLVDDMKGLGIRSRLAIQILAVLTLLPFLQSLPPVLTGFGLSIEGW